MYERMGFGAGDCLLVTGGGSGIGRAIALGAGSLGVGVALWDINAETAQAVADEVDAAGGSAIAVTADVSDPAAVAAALERTLAWRTPNVLINNAGPASAVPRPFADGVVGVVGSVDLVTTSWLEAVADAGDAVVNIASIAGTVIGGASSWYAAAKAGVIGYTRQLAAAAPHGIRVNAVAPGLVDTPRMTEFMESDLGRRMVARTARGAAVRPEEIAAAALFLACPLASAITGTALVVDAGVSVTV